MNRTWAPDRAEEAPAPARVLGGRYRLIAPLGRGGFGEVWRGVDEAAATDVAIKLPLASSAEIAERARREVAALRLVQHPGVVRLLDAGMDEGQVYVVMELVRGLPFPGVPTPAAWSTLEPVAHGVLRALAGVHAQGLVHRDLKPANILVDGDRVTLLDFGIARGEALGSTLTAADAWVGSPRYLAPEQLTDAPKDARTDLYAVGVLLYEALCGESPFTASTLDELLRSRFAADPPPLRTRAPEVPEVVAAVVDRLLRRAPHERFPSALAVIGALDPDRSPRELPWLGGREAVDAIVERAQQGRPTDIGGGRGSGRSRTLREAARRLGDGGVVHTLASGKRALESLRPVLGSLPGADPVAAAEAELRRRLAGGEIVVVDDPARLDFVSRGIVERVRDAGALLRGVDGPGDLQPVPLAEADLRALFHGPELLHHLPSDGAHALMERTAGLPARLAAEVEAWVFGGLARWEGDRLTTDRAALERLELGVTPSAPGISAPTLDPALDELLGWIFVAGRIDAPTLAAARGEEPWELREPLEALEALGALRTGPDGRLAAVANASVLRRWTAEDRESVHHRLARALSPGSPGRLAHLGGAGALKGLAEEAETLAGRRIPEGRLGAALSLLELALQAGAGDAEREQERALRLTRVALAIGSVATLRRARYVVTPMSVAAGALLEAWEAAQAGELAQAAAMSPALTGDPEIDAWWTLIRVRASVETDLAAAEAHIDTLAAEPGSAVARRKEEWRANLRFRAARYAEAAALHAAVAEAEPVADRRVTARINAAFALREDGRYEEALAQLEEAARAAEAHRLTVLEAFARVGIRSLEYRLDRPGPPDLALLDALRPLQVDALSAQAVLNEAIVAWRAGDPTQASRLAAEAREAFARHGGRIGLAYARGLLALLGEPEPVGDLWTGVLDGLPLAEAEVGTLLVLAGHPEAKPMARRGLAAMPEIEPRKRQAVFTVGEVERVVT